MKTGEEYANTDYLSGFQYRSSYTNAQGDQSEATLQYFPHAEGYVQHVGGEFFYIYNYTDHLGNIRLSYTFDYASGLIKIMEENHYYPFSLKHDSYNTNRLGYSSYIDDNEVAYHVLEEKPKFVGDGSYNYKYNGKEYQDELGLNMYDYGARNYDAALGRWMNIDPLAEKFENLTPYQYAGNNSVYFLDVNGEYIYINDNDGSGKQYRYQNGETQHQVDGKWTKIDATVELSDFVCNTVAGLYALENSGNTGKSVVGHFSGDKNDISFTESDNPAGYKSGNISLNFQKQESSFVKIRNGGLSYQESPLYVTIGHEMAHGMDPVKVNFMYDWYPTKSGPVSKSEIYATHYENMIRAESGLPLRSHYGVVINGSTGLASPDPRSRIIDKMGNSVYYGHNDSKNEPRQIGATINDGLKADGGQILKSRFNYYEGR